MFELFNDEDSNFRFRIKGPDGAVMATSRAFPDKVSAVAGIRDTRESAEWAPSLTCACHGWLMRSLSGWAR
ncbi:uncharacterized protein YegP (UPF0339 family) [Pseudarthrobacter sp. W1I19]|uniref:YegP family protein n=1 Tax=Pseudarthrobacter sp. W1I19 TaxID=3042288 RepID=UPI00277DE837|nr:DUF1508 domain-containing protein [Pseudarthrobacter sp. W1I19]MDQ0925662.1 uncharacterized protein YegP (UPF0339 family) [Pseudarthrobacter sp. W1I19]